MRNKNYCIDCFNKKCGTNYRKKDIMFDGRLLRCDGCGKFTEETVFCVWKREKRFTEYELRGWVLYYPLFILDWILDLIIYLLLLPYRLYLKKKKNREKDDMD